MNKREDNLILFLDIDGVLNDHTKMDNNYCGMKSSCVKCLNRVLDAIPDLKIVISSAWRYSILKHDMTVKGFELMMLTHGLKCFGRIIDCTEVDGELEDEPSETRTWHESGLKWRANQIKKWIQHNNPNDWIAIDDLDLNLDPFNFHKTNGDTGLTPTDADILILRLLEKR